MPVPRDNADQTKGYRAFIAIIKTVIRILVIVFVIIAAYFLIRNAYKIGYDVTGNVPVDKSDDAFETMVIISKDMSVKDIGELLIDKGLIKEEANSFVIQEWISDYHDEIVPGTYVLNSSMTVEEMLKIMCRDEETEG